MKKLSELFILKTNTTSVQLFRYFFVGGISFIIDSFFLFFLTEIGKINYLISAAISFLLGLACNYILSISWVFSERVLENRWMEFSLFSVIGIVGVLLNEGLIWVLTEKIRIYYLYSKIITAAIVFFWNFFARKIGLFSKLTRVEM